MRRVFYFLTLFAIISTISFYSCSSDNNTQNETSNQLIKTKINNTPLVIGEINKNDVFEITADPSVILDNWNYNLLTHGSIDAQLTDLLVFKEDGVYYLKAKGALWGSTTILNVDSFGQGTSGSITCTSKDCSDSSTGCVPKKDGKACTACGPFGAGDCTKSVTSKSAITDMYLAQMDIFFE